MRNVQRNRVHALMQRAEIASFELPESLTQALQVEKGLTEAQRTTREAMGSAPDFEAELRAAGMLPPGFSKRLATSMEMRRVMLEQSRFVDSALEWATDRVVSAVAQDSESIIATRLRPRFVEVLVEVGRLAALAPDVPWDDIERAMDASDDQRRVFFGVRDLQKVISALRDAQEICYGFTGTMNDAITFGTTIRNLREIWPSFSTRGSASTPPWPKHPLRYLVWLASSDAQPWMPTRAEAEEAWLARLSPKQMYPNEAPVYVGPS